MTWLLNLFRRPPRCGEPWQRKYWGEMWTCILPAGHDDDHEWRAPR